MKNLFSKLMFVAMAATLFVACEDVPEPYDVPGHGGNVPGPDTEIKGGTGTGTKADPFNAVAALNYGNKLTSGEESPGYMFIKGKVVSVKEEFTTQYGNGTFYISADGKAGNQFYAYRVLYLGNKKFTSSDEQIKVGDEVVICGIITNYNGTIETAQNKGFLYELNGVNRGGDPQENTPGEAKGDGTLANPFNSVAAIAFAQKTGEAESEDVYIKGKVASITEQYGTQYGNATFTISDDGTSNNAFTVYRALYLGNKKYTSGELLREGNDVIICGKVTNFKGNTPETVAGKAYLYSLNGNTENNNDTPDPQPGKGEGKGTADSPYNVIAAMAAASGTGVYVKGFIVGTVTGQTLATGAVFSDAAEAQTNLLIAASANETNVENCMPVQLPSGDIRTALNLVDNKGNYKKEVTLYGNIEKYFGATGIKSVSYAILDGKQIGTNPEGGNDNPSSDVKKVTIAEFNAASESNDVWYELTGTVKNLKEGDQYGNFDLEDATGSVYVYGLLSEKDGAKKLFQELVAAKGIQEGSKITIIGNRGSYNGKIEVMNAYFVSIESQGGSAGDAVKAISIADFIKAEVNDNVWYQLTGVVKNLKEGDLYGNFDLEDSTGSVYVYGVLSEKGGAKKLFQDLVAAKGIKNGSTLTIIGTRGEYKGKIEVMNAYFVSVKN